LRQVSFSGTDPLKIKNWIDDLRTTKEDFVGYGSGVPVACVGDCKVRAPRR